VIFGAKYLGSTQLVSERNPPPSVRMAQAQEAVDRIKVWQGRGARLPPAWALVGAGPCSGPPAAGQGHGGVLAAAVTLPGRFLLQAPDGESQPMTEVDLFVSTQRIKVLTADTQVSGEREPPPGFGAAGTFLFGLWISALHPRWRGRARGWPTGEDARLGGGVSLHSHPAQTRRVPRPSAWLHEASHANGAARELLGSQSKLRGT